VMPPRLRGEVRAIQQATDTLPGTAVAIDGELLLVLARSCRDTVRVRFTYAARSAEVTHRLVEPVRLVATGRRWYLLAWDVDRGEWRVFRLDRMTDVAATTWRFPPREHPDPAGHVQRAVSSAPYRVRAKVEVQAPADQIRARLPAAAGLVTEIDAASCLLETGADEAWALAVQLGWLGAEFRVLEPDELASAVARLAERYARAAAGSVPAP
jgi:predicted DNA-binding transcriptional regulator YafY